MKTIITTAIVALLLSGCKTMTKYEEDMAQLKPYERACEQGDQAACDFFLAKMQQFQMEDQQRRARGAALLGLSNQIYLQNQARQPQPPVNVTCSQAGNFIDCTAY